MLQYLHTDSACCRDEPGPLADRQAQVPLLMTHRTSALHHADHFSHQPMILHFEPFAVGGWAPIFCSDIVHVLLTQVFDPVVRWFEQRLGVSLRVDDSIMGAEQVRQSRLCVTICQVNPTWSMAVGSRHSLSGLVTACYIPMRSRPMKGSLYRNQNDCAVARPCVAAPQVAPHMPSGLSRWHLAITDAAAAACRSVVFGIALAEVCCCHPPGRRSRAREQRCCVARS